MSDLVKFLSAVKSHWVTLVTGSFLADHRIELLIGVYPLTEEGETDQRWFYIVPQNGPASTPYTAAWS